MRRAAPYLWTGLCLSLALEVRPALGETTAVLTPEERRWLAENPEKLTLYYNTEFPPIEYASPSGSFVGLGAEVIAMLEKRIGVSFRKLPSSDWNRHLEALESGACAVAPTIVRTPDRDRFARFTVPYATVPVVIITTRGRRRVLGLDDLAGRRVVVVSGYATERYLREQSRGRFQIVTAANVVKALHEVSFGQADALVENLAVAAHFIDREGIPNLRVAGSTDFAFAWSVGVSRKFPLLFSAIQKGLAAIPEAELARARKRWISLEPPSGMDPERARLLQLAALFAAALLLGLGGVSLLLKRRLDEKVRSLKLAQAGLLEQSSRLALATEATKAGIWDFFPRTGEAYFNQQWYAVLGYPPEAVEPTIAGWRSLVHPEDLAAFTRCLETESAETFELEYRMRQSDGTWRWVLAKGRVIAWDERRAPSRLIGLNLDIQKLKQVEEELRGSEELYRGLISAIPDGVMRTALDGTIIYLNEVELPLLTKLGRDAVIGRNMIELLAPEDRARALEKTRQMFEAYQGIQEYRVPTSDGEVTTVEVNGDVLRDAKGTPFGMVYVVRDVTSRKQAEQALQVSESRFRELFEMAAIPLLFGARDGTVLGLNRRFSEVLGYRHEEIPTEDRFWELGWPDPVTRRRERRVWIASVEQAIAGGGEIPAREYQVTCGDAKLRTVLVEGRVLGGNLLVSFFDLTALKRAEEEREQLNLQLLQSQKLEAVGRLAGGVAHDFNNMLGVILGNVELCMLDLDPRSPLYEDLQTIRTAGERSAELTRQLLAFARKQPVVPEVLDLNETLEGLLKMLRRLIGEDITLIWRPGNSLWRVEIDPTQVNQILVNLCVNARDAIEDVGQVVIETSNVTLERDPGGSRDFVRLAVHDTGRGLDQATRARIFEPFFSTKGQGKGTGLGLATVYGIVQQNHGQIQVASKPGEGASFEILLPRSTAAPTRAPSATDPSPPRGEETVLLVEDEPALLMVTGDMLAHLGYRVLAASSPDEALRLASAHPREIQLLLTDLVMPGLNGRELADRLLAEAPGLRCLFMSGYPSGVISDRADDEGIGFLAKPFTIEDLARKIRGVLGGSPA